MSVTRRTLPARLCGLRARAGRPASPVPTSRLPSAANAMRPVLPVRPRGIPVSTGVTGPLQREGDDAVVLRRRDVGEDQVVLAVVRRDGEIEQAAVAGGAQPGHDADGAHRLVRLRLHPHDAPGRALADERGVVGHHRQADRGAQVLGDDRRVTALGGRARARSLAGRPVGAWVRGWIGCGLRRRLIALAGERRLRLPVRPGAGRARRAAGERSDATTAAPSIAARPCARASSLPAHAVSAAATSLERVITVCVPSESSRDQLEPVPDGVRVLVWDGEGEPPDGRRRHRVPARRLHGRRRGRVRRACPGCRSSSCCRPASSRGCRTCPDGVMLCNGRGVHGPATAELAVAGHPRDHPPAAALPRRAGGARWTERHTEDLDGKRVLVLGAGDIGKHVADALAVFGAADHLRRPHRPRRRARHRRAARPAARRRHRRDRAAADRRDDRAHRRRRSSPRCPTARSWSTSRAARSSTPTRCSPRPQPGRLRAFLDVTDPEPLPADHPLWDAPNLVITPHVGGGTHGWQRRGYRLVREQIERYVAGEPLRERRRRDLLSRWSAARPPHPARGRFDGANLRTGGRDVRQPSVADLRRSRRDRPCVRTAAVPTRRRARRRPRGRSPTARAPRPTASVRDPNAARTRRPSGETMVAVRAMNTAARTGITSNPRPPGPPDRAARVAAVRGERERRGAEEQEQHREVGRARQPEGDASWRPRSQRRR